MGDPNPDADGPESYATAADADRADEPTFDATFLAIAAGSLVLVLVIAAVILALVLRHLHTPGA